MFRQVLIQDEVRFIHWIDPVSKCGRPVYLDNGGRVVYSIPFLIPSMSLDNAEILVSDMNARMHKVTAVHREPLPAPSKRLMTIFQTAQMRRAHNSIQIPLTTGVCCVCNRDISVDTEIVRECSLCLHGFHDRSDIKFI